MTNPADPPSGPTPRITAESSLAEVALAYAGAGRVFARHGLDFCCQGRRTIAAACGEKQIDPEQVLAELRAELVPFPLLERWDDRPLAQLIVHIVDQCHARHRAELPRLVALAAQVEAAHAADPACPRGLAATLGRFGADLEQHMRREEETVFPMLLAGWGVDAGPRLDALVHEHDGHAADLDALRRLTHDFTPPAEASPTWRALYLGLADFERDFCRHVHLENHVLFPRAARREAR